MKKLSVLLFLLIFVLNSFAQSTPEFTTIKGKVFFKNQYSLLNNTIYILGTNEASIISDHKDAAGGRDYRLEVPKDRDVYVTINKTYIAKINSSLKSNDIYIYDGEKNQTNKLLEEWNKNKKANEDFFGTAYMGRFNSKAMLDSNHDIVISEPVGKRSAPAKKVDLENDLFDFVDPILDKIPSFPGGDNKFKEFIKSSMTYPALAKERNVQGKVYVQFIVEKDGSLTDLKLPRSLGSGCDEEAMRLMKASAKWEPATSKGIKVRCKYNTRIDFSLF